MSQSADDYFASPSEDPLRICCYGSSSSLTPLEYLTQAETLGRTLARRGHICVNGAGSSGCMAAMNDGASAEGGRIVGVIHEMFVVDGSDWVSKEGGAHSAFHEGKREILVAGGNDLQERKRLLVEGADALIVLPGGTICCITVVGLRYILNERNMLTHTSCFFCRDALRILRSLYNR